MIRATIPWAGSPADDILEGIVVPPQWVSRALCRANPDLFFSDDPDEQEQAKRICAGCPVRTVCLEWAMTEPPEFGVWGGLSEADRAGGSKRCTQCGKTKPLDQFHLQATKNRGRGRGVERTRDGHHNICKLCYNARQRQRRNGIAASPRPEQPPARVTVSQLAEIRPRHAAGETITELAQELGVSRTHLGRLLSGERVPAPDPVVDTTRPKTSEAGSVAA